MKLSKKTQHDPVKNPSHYGKICNMDVWKLIAQIVEVCAIGKTQACLFFNVFKYLIRCNKKGKVIEDLEKAKKYINLSIEHIKSDETESKEVNVTSRGWTKTKNKNK